jgi:hypothetical protein
MKETTTSSRALSPGLLAKAMLLFLASAVFGGGIVAILGSRSQKNVETAAVRLVDIELVSTTIPDPERDQPVESTETELQAWLSAFSAPELVLTIPASDAKEVVALSLKSKFLAPIEVQGRYVDTIAWLRDTVDAVENTPVFATSRARLSRLRTVVTNPNAHQRETDFLGSVANDPFYSDDFSNLVRLLRRAHESSGVALLEAAAEQVRGPLRWGVDTFETSNGRERRVLLGKDQYIAVRNEMQDDNDGRAIAKLLGQFDLQHVSQLLETAIGVFDEELALFRRFRAASQTLVDAHLRPKVRVQSVLFAPGSQPVGVQPEAQLRAMLSRADGGDAPTATVTLASEREPRPGENADRAPELLRSDRFVAIIPGQRNNAGWVGEVDTSTWGQLRSALVAGRLSATLEVRTTEGVVVSSPPTALDPRREQRLSEEPRRASK